MKKISLLFLLTSLCLFTKAQNKDPLRDFDISHSGKKVSIDSVAEIYNNTAMYIDGNGKYIIDNQEVPLGFFNSNLKNEIRRSPEGGTEMKLFGKQATRGAILMVGSLVGTIVIVAATGSSVGFLLFIPYFAGIFDMIHAQKHFQKAIWAYNRDALINGINKHQ